MRRTICSAWFELKPSGLSKSRMPWTSRVSLRFIGGYPSSFRRRPESILFRVEDQNGSRPAPGRRESFLGAAIVAQQRFDALALVDRIVVAKAQLRHAPELQRARELAPELLRHLVQRL